jgi:hypothetical protein
MRGPDGCTAPADALPAQRAARPTRCQTGRAAVDASAALAASMRPTDHHKR